MCLNVDKIAFKASHEKRKDLNEFRGLQSLMSDISFR